MLKIFVFASCLAAFPAVADTIFLQAIERGWVNTDGTTNGASPINNYIAGQLNSTEVFRNWFEFSIPAISNPFGSATLFLGGDHSGGALLYSVYALAGQPLDFSDVSASSFFGSIITVASGGVSITLNDLAVGAINGQAGGNFFAGGIDSGENSTASDFGGSERFQSVLELTTVPEPRPNGLVVVLVLALAGMRRRSMG